VADLRLARLGREYTFRRVEGHPELQLTLRSRDTTSRVGGWVVLAAVATLGVWLGRRARPATRTGSAAAGMRGSRA
jgi:hypothetical protein